ncbi:MFS transporter [Anabaena cylindrica FACHB-243]|uniref:Major facilitator superfamily MFS_1 n=1 Tax=Anabaena cylindrica (strain ATCC 27899 / PCC 7122) TaxID=272123 RepID=K9ZK34_ANACC|nr:MULTISPECIES: MFS transporter [Anabaena]AFZ59603.1 major facilitator superfamily MFS_1 [Anabaena cylindrica PCC 7122]MBD2418733.1 MFS transporter [Anabaena cylindrica FACHB-243]MBY5281640.1 MFS transporter [Anabaena sp. CCAP 1446/1C]MBY5309166.1 MFS transporter [Anabaena sp. CCAP 1446/1C]MCM2406297.1 MFS transporter [Anabaena sp. CCAP 1446/1C]
MSSSKQKPTDHNPKAAQHDPFAAMRFRDYRLFSIGRVLLFTGGQMQTVALGWELYERTNSAMVLGLIGLAQVVPMIALTLITGHVADKNDRKKITLFSILLLALCSIALAVISFNKGAVFLVYGCLLLTGVARAFLKPAGDALMWQLIPMSAFTNAATWNSSSFQLASVIGPALGGFSIAIFGSATWVYILSAIAALSCFFLTATIKPQKTNFKKEPISLKSLAAGAEFVWNNQLILAAITLDLFAVLLGGAVALLPVFAKDILQVGPVELGYLQAAPSIGALSMAALLVYLPPIRKAGPALLWSVVGFGIVTIIFGLSRWVWLSLLMLALSGALDSISVVIRHTLVQIRTPDHLRGRVAAINSVFISASNELGGFESGLTAALFGPVLSVVGGGIGTILVVVATAMIWPDIRKLGALHEDL